MSISTNRIISPGKLVWAGTSLIAVVGLIHLLEVPEELEEVTYLGLLFLANFGGAVVAAIGIYRNVKVGLGVRNTGRWRRFRRLRDQPHDRSARVAR